MQSIHIYRRPFSVALKSIAISDPRVHFGRYRHAIDFILPIGTPILAAKMGIIDEIKLNSRNGGQNIRYGHPKFLNYIVLKHKDEEYSLYGHLAHKSSELTVGTVVRSGQVIARSGVSGLMTIPHLHFHVFGYDKLKLVVTVKARFSTNVKVHIPRGHIRNEAALFSYIRIRRAYEERDN